MNVRRILIVEDEPILREILFNLLQELRFEVVQAGDGFEALQHLKKSSFSLIISDIQMPKMNGFELLANAKGLGVHTPLIFISAFGDRENMLKALQLGAFDFIQKPFDSNEVLDLVDRAIEVGHRRNEIRRNLRGLATDIKESNLKHEQMIHMIEIQNFKKRA